MYLTYLNLSASAQFLKDFLTLKPDDAQPSAIHVLKEMEMLPEDVEASGQWDPPNRAMAAWMGYESDLSNDDPLDDLLEDEGTKEEGDAAVVVLRASYWMVYRDCWNL